MATRDFGHSGYRSIPAGRISHHLSTASRLGCIVQMIFCFRFNGISKFPFIHGSSAAPGGVPVRGLGQRRGRVRAAVAQRPSGRHVQCRYRDGLLSRRFLFRLSVRRGRGFHGLAGTGPKLHRPAVKAADDAVRARILLAPPATSQRFQVPDVSVNLDFGSCNILRFL